MNNWSLIIPLSGRTKLNICKASDSHHYSRLIPTKHFLQCICGCFTEQGDGTGQILSLASTAVQLYQPLHQVTIATPAITNLTRITHTPEKRGGGLSDDTTIHIHSHKTNKELKAETETVCDMSCISPSPGFRPDSRFTTDPGSSPNSHFSTTSSSSF